MTAGSVTPGAVAAGTAGGGVAEGCTGGAGGPATAEVVGGACVSLADEVEPDNCMAMPTIAPITKQSVATPAAIPTHVSGRDLAGGENGSVLKVPF